MKAEPRSEVVHDHASGLNSFHVGDCRGQRVRDLLHRIGPRFARVIPRDADRIEARHVVLAVGDDVAD